MIPMRCTCPKVDTIGPHDPMPGCKSAPAGNAEAVLTDDERLDAVARTALSIQAAGGSHEEFLKILRENKTLRAEMKTVLGELARQGDRADALLADVNRETQRRMEADAQRDTAEAEVARLTRELKLEHEFIDGTLIPERNRTHDRADAAEAALKEKTEDFDKTALAWAKAADERDRNTMRYEKAEAALKKAEEERDQLALLVVSADTQGWTEDEDPTQIKQVVIELINLAKEVLSG